MDEIIPSSKIPSNAEFIAAVEEHHRHEAELLAARRQYRGSIEELDRLFARSVGHVLKLSGDVVALNFVVAGERLPQERAAWNEVYFGPLRPDIYIVTGGPIETEFEAALVTPEDAPPEGPERVVAYHSLRVYSTLRELHSAQRVFDRDHPV